jgi:hypothetical protein
LLDPDPSVKMYFNFKKNIFLTSVKNGLFGIIFSFKRKIPFDNDKPKRALKIVTNQCG